MNKHFLLMVDDRVEEAAFPDRAALSKPPAMAGPPPRGWLRTTPSCTSLRLWQLILAGNESDTTVLVYVGNNWHCGTHARSMNAFKSKYSRHHE